MKSVFPKNDLWTEGLLIHWSYYPGPVLVHHVLGSLQEEFVRLSPLIDWSIPAHNTHTVHTHLVGFSQFEPCVLPSVCLIWAYFFLWAILSAFRPLSLSEQVKNKDPPKIATKVTPPFIHSSLCPPSSLLLTLSSPSTQRQEGSVQSTPPLSTSLPAVLGGGSSSALLYL